MILLCLFQVNINEFETEVMKIVFTTCITARSNDSTSDTPDPITSTNAATANVHMFGVVQWFSIE